MRTPGADNRTEGRGAKRQLAILFPALLAATLALAC